MEALEPADSWDWDVLRAVCLRQARAILREGAAAEDAAQEALLRAWRRRARCERGEDPRAWVGAIARREALRIAARRAELPIDVESPATGPSPEPPILLRLDVREAIKQLPATDREILTRRFWGDMTCRETARTLGMAEATVRVRLHRLRSTLRKTLTEA